MSYVTDIILVVSCCESVENFTNAASLDDGALLTGGVRYGKAEQADVYRWTANYLNPIEFNTIRSAFKNTKWTEPAQASLTIIEEDKPAQIWRV